MKYKKMSAKINMAEGVLRNSISILVGAIKGITMLIEEFNLRNESILSLHREILQLRPCIENLQKSADTSGVHNRIQRMVVLLEEIKIWMEVFASKSTLTHFFCALGHKKEINRFYIRIQELKMEMGFEMKVDAHLYQARLVAQMQELIDSLRGNADFEKMNAVVEYQRRVYEMKLENHLGIIQDIDLKYSRLVGEYECELDDMKQRTQTMQHQIDMMESRMLDLHDKVIMIENLRKDAPQTASLPKSASGTILDLCFGTRPDTHSNIDILTPSESKVCEEVMIRVHKLVDVRVMETQMYLQKRIAGEVDRKMSGSSISAAGKSDDTLTLAKCRRCNTPFSGDRWGSEETPFAASDMCFSEAAQRCRKIGACNGAGGDPALTCACRVAGKRDIPGTLREWRDAWTSTVEGHDLGPPFSMRPIWNIYNYVESE